MLNLMQVSFVTSSSAMSTAISPSLAMSTRRPPPPPGLARQQGSRRRRRRRGQEEQEEQESMVTVRGTVTDCRGCSGHWLELLGADLGIDTRGTRLAG